MHPEIVLTMDEATTLFAVAQGAVVAIMKDVEKRTQANSTAVAVPPVASAVTSGTS
jgi:hypothetical protein